MTDEQWLKTCGILNTVTLDALIERIAIKIAQGIPEDEARTQTFQEYLGPL